MTETTPPRQRTMYFLGLRIGTYTGISFLTFLTKVVPATRLLSVLVVVGYFLYMVADTLKIANSTEREHGKETSLRHAFNANMQDFAYYVIAFIVGISI